MSVKSFWVNSPKVGYSIQILDNKIHYIEHEANGECIILLHGLGFSMFSMRNMYEELAKKDYRVFAIDLHRRATPARALAMAADLSWKESLR